MKQLFLFSLILFAALHGHAQRGKDGSHTVTSLNALVNSYTVLNANASAGQTLITVASNTMVGGFFQGVLTPGDLIMIIQMQGAILNVDTYPASEYISSNNFSEKDAEMFMKAYDYSEEKNSKKEVYIN
jgi:hypothetical protein